MVALDAASATTVCLATVPVLFCPAAGAAALGVDAAAHSMPQEARISCDPGKNFTQAAAAAARTTTESTSCFQTDIRYPGFALPFLPCNIDAGRESHTTPPPKCEINQSAKVPPI